MTRYEKRDVVVRTRLSEREKSSLDSRAKMLGVTTSSLIRALANIPIRARQDEDGISMPEFIVFDEKSLTRLTQSINTYGTLLNQAVKSLNTLAKLGSAGHEDTLAKLDHISMQLDQVYAGVIIVETEAAQIVDNAMVYLEDADGRSTKW